jgi:diamine N-acetyltransferase
MVTKACMPFPEHTRLVPIIEKDFATLARLAEVIWRSHYIQIITGEQIEYMLAGRYVPEKLRTYLGSDKRWLELLWQGGEAIGYCSYALTERADEMKLEQLYLLPTLHGKGLGGEMLRHVEQQARGKGMKSLMLTVNKHNAGSIAVYRKAGFTIREEARFDIGAGFVMDDYIMAKVL